VRIRKNIYFPTECFYCGIEIPTKHQHTYDHIIPLSEGGANHISNLVDCCFKCNQLKANKSVDDFEKDLQDSVTQLSPKAPQYAYYVSILNRLKATKKNDDLNEATEFDWEE